jgi:hypothetical protein
MNTSTDSDEKKPPNDNKRGAQGRNKQQNQKNVGIKPFVKKFDGECEGLKGYIFDCANPKQADLYSTTCKAIARYVGREYKKGGDMQSVILELEIPVFDEPDAPDENTATRAELRRYDARIDELTKKENQLHDNIKKLFSLVWGQCTKAMQSKTETMPGYTASMQWNGTALYHKGSIIPIQ